jgi:RNA polymerase sigma factor (sigma-70 family)
MSYYENLKNVQSILKNFISSRIYSNHDAEDILQETNRILCIKKHDYDPSKNFKAWAYTIASFQIKAYLSKIKRSKLVFYSDEGCSDLNCGRNSENGAKNKPYDVFGVESSPLEILDSKEAEKELSENIRLSKESLSNYERQVFELSSLDYKNKQIARILRIKEGSVSAYKSRAIEKVRKAINAIPK